LQLHFGLDAFIEASLLGFKWRKDWDLVNKTLDYRWQHGAALALNMDGPPNSISPQMTFGDEQLQLEDLACQVFTAATSEEKLEPLNQPTGPGDGGGAPVAAGELAVAPPLRPRDATRAIQSR
jgi:hypothetical protein